MRKTFYCCDKILWPQSNTGNKGFIWLTISGFGPIFYWHWSRNPIGRHMKFTTVKDEMRKPIHGLLSADALLPFLQHSEPRSWSVATHIQGKSWWSSSSTKTHPQVNTVSSKAEGLQWVIPSCSWLIFKTKHHIEFLIIFNLLTKWRNSVNCHV